MSREVMKLALDMLNEIADDVYCDQKLEGVITALRQALEKQWVGLTYEEIDILSCEMVKGYKSVNWLCKVLETKLKEKNHG